MHSMADADPSFLSWLGVLGVDRASGVSAGQVAIWQVVNHPPRLPGQAGILNTSVRINCDGVDWSEIDLTGQPCGAGTFHRANLRGAKFTKDGGIGGLVMGWAIEADLTAAILTNGTLGANWMAGSTLANAEMSGATLSYVDLTGADLTGANLASAKLDTVNLTGTDLTGADLTGATLTKCTWDQTTRWPAGFTPPGDSTPPPEGPVPMLAMVEMVGSRFGAGL